MTWWGVGRRPPRAAPPPPPAARHVRVTVRDAEHRPVPQASGVLSVDEGQRYPGRNDDGRLTFTLAPQEWVGVGATLELAAAGFQPWRNVRGQYDIVLPAGDLDLPDIHLERTVPPLARLRAEGRRLVRSDGRPWVWQGASAFRLLELVATGRQAEVNAYLAWAAAHDISIVRVFAMAGAHAGDGVPYLFRLAPEDGRRALPELLTLAARHGLYVEVVMLVDTKFFTVDHQPHVQAIGAVLAEHVNAVGQIANEPRHATQLGDVSDPAYLAALRRLVPADVPVTLGPAHGSDDANFAWARGDFVTVHFDRANGEDDFTHDGFGLRWVRHLKDGLDTSEALGKYVVNDEPKRNDLTPWKHTAVAILCRLLGLGDTFHSGGGLQARIPEGAELAALEGRRRGWRAIPMDWHGRFYNVGHAGSMVPDADWSTALKVFSSAQGDTAYTLAIGSAQPRVTWSADWPSRELVLQDGGCLLWRLQR